MIVMYIQSNKLKKIVNQEKCNKNVRNAFITIYDALNASAVTGLIIMAFIVAPTDTIQNANAKIQVKKEIPREWTYFYKIQKKPAERLALPLNVASTDTIQNARTAIRQLEENRNL